MRVPRPFPCLLLLALLLPWPRGFAQPPATPTGHRRMDPGFQERQGMLLFQQGDSPRALLHLQRARLCAPGNPRLLQELDQVRNTLPKASRTSLPKPLLPFPYLPTFPQLVAATLAAWGLLCLTLLALLWHRKRGLQRLALSLALLTLLLATPTLAWTWRLHQTSPAVVITPEAQPRSGPGNTFPQTATPLPQGSEVTLHYTQGKWCRVTLPDNSPAWLPKNSLYH